MNKYSHFRKHSMSINDMKKAITFVMAFNKISFHYNSKSNLLLLRVVPFPDELLWQLHLLFQQNLRRLMHK